jgi:hypothetical protein
VGIERPDDADVPRGEHPDRPVRPAPDAGRQTGEDQVETRYRQECYVDLRAAAGIEERTEPAGRAEPGARSKPLEPTENKQQAKPAENGQQAKASASWEEMAKLGRWMWGEYERKWRADERSQVDRSSDPPGSWRGDSTRFLNHAVNEDLEEECDHIAQRERERFSPALHKVESHDPDRQLVGLEYRLKDRDGIKEKVAEAIEQYGRSPKEAVSLVPDAIRYTFQYMEARYTQGVRDDIARLKEQGFEMVGLKNSWLDEQYKGINSRWIEPDSGQRFEVQFHTRISFEAKQLTHSAYERLRSGQADEFEEMVLEAFQAKVAAAVPVPPGAADIPDYPEREQHAR